MNVTYRVVESPHGTLHLEVQGRGEFRSFDGQLACGRKGDGWQVVIGRHFRGVPMCRPCLRAMQRMVAGSRVDVNVTDVESVTLPDPEKFGPWDNKEAPGM